MPTYEYQCVACGHAFEKFHSITAKPVKECPSCHKKQVKRLIGTGAGLIFKGSGFYITDYRSDSYKSAAKSDSSTSASSPTTTKSTPAPAATAKPEAPKSKASATPTTKS